MIRDKYSIPGAEECLAARRKMPPNGQAVLGIDPSLTATGIAVVVLDEDGSTVAAAATTLKVPSKVDNIDRIYYIAQNVSLWIYHFGHTLTSIVIEDLPTMAKGAGLTGQSQGAVRYGISDGVKHGDCHIVALAAATLKKFITGSGKADKKAVMAAVRERIGDFVDIADDNQGDAMALALYGVEVLNGGAEAPHRVLRARK